MEQSWKDFWLGGCLCVGFMPIPCPCFPRDALCQNLGRATSPHLKNCSLVILGCTGLPHRHLRTSVPLHAWLGWTSAIAHPPLRTFLYTTLWARGQFPGWAMVSRKAVNAGAGAVNQKEGGWFPCCWVLGGLSSRGEKRWSGSWGPAELNLIWDWGRSWAQHSTTWRTTVPRNDFQTPGVGKAQTLPIHWKTRNEPTKRNCSFWSQYLLNWRKTVLLLRKSRIVSVLSLKLVVLESLVVPSRPSPNELRQTLDVSSSQGGSITCISCRGAFWASRANLGQTQPAAHLCMPLPTPYSSSVCEC